VESDVNKMEEMLSLSGGELRVPVIVENGEVTIGFGGTSQAGET